MKRRGIFIALAGSDSHSIEVIANHLSTEHGYARHSWLDAVRGIGLSANPLVWQPKGEKKAQRLASVVADIGWKSAESIPAIRSYLRTISEGMSEHIGDDVIAGAVCAKIAKEIRNGRNVLITETTRKCEVKAVSNLDGNLLVVSRDPDSEELSKYAFASVEVWASDDALRRNTDIIHRTLDAEANGDMDAMVSPDIYVARMDRTVQRCIAMAAKSIVGISAPEHVGAEEFASRHRVNVSASRDGPVEVRIDGDLAGEVFYEDGLLTIEARIAR